MEESAEEIYGTKRRMVVTTFQQPWRLSFGFVLQRRYGGVLLYVKLLFIFGRYGGVL